MRYLNNVLKILIVMASLSLAVSFFMVESLPRVSEMYLESDQEPIQSAAGDEDLSIERNGYTAHINEQYEYEIWGLVVEDYVADNWLDYSHKNDPFNTRDLCIVWGDNLDDLILEEMEFSHGEFTCFYQTSNQEAYQLFNPSQLSNNHLIPANNIISRAIKNVRVGDQVYIKGSLVTLSVDMPDGRSWARSTSVTRDDTGNGACELIYTREIEVIDAANSLWRNINFWSLWLGVFSLIIVILSFIIETVQSYYGRVK